MPTKEYVLGTDQEELNRLNLQHELWKAAALDLWDNVGFKRDQHLLDLGCGPGFTSLELSRRVGSKGSITAVDASQRFLDHLGEFHKDSHMGAIETVQSYAEKLNLTKKDFDGAYCRWLMIFVQEPLKALQAVYDHLRPGAMFALQEYISYETMALAPDRAIMNTVVAAVFKSWREQGGDPNRGRDLPTLMAQVGFKNIRSEPLLKFVQPKDPLWAWPDSYYRSFVPRLVQGGYITEAQSEEFFAIWNEASNEPQTFFISPMMINISAEK